MCEWNEKKEKQKKLTNELITKLTRARSRSFAYSVSALCTRFSTKRNSLKAHRVICGMKDEIKYALKTSRCAAICYSFDNGEIRTVC